MTSVYNPTLGAPDTQETSGKAINARQKQGDNAHFHYSDNLARSVRHATRIELALFPYIYSEAREASISDPDGSQRIVKLNQEFLDPKTGKSTIFNINSETARYHVTVGTGPSYASRRAQQTDVLMQLTNSMPGPMSRALDLILRYIDAPEEIIERLRPPDVAVQQDSEHGEGPNIHQLQMAYGQQKQLIAKLASALQTVTADLQTKRLEVESGERKNALDNMTKLRVAALQTGAATAMAGLEAEAASIEHRLNLLHENIPLIASDGPASSQPAASAPPAQQPTDAGA
jgi:hypothetical protein